MSAIRAVPGACGVAAVEFGLRLHARQNLSLFVPFVVSSSSVGMIMGWLYTRYGLVSAIAAHLVTDLVIYVIPRLVAVIT